MVWPFGSSDSKKDEKHDDPKSRPVSWTDSLGDPEIDSFTTVKQWAPAVAASLVGIAALQLYTNYFRRIPGAAHVRHNFFRSRSIYGRVTSVGDGDGFRLFHTPGGRAAGWGWLRKVPESRKELKDKTVWMIEEHYGSLEANQTMDRSRFGSQASTPPKLPTSANQRSHSLPKLYSG